MTEHADNPNRKGRIGVSFRPGGMYFLNKVRYATKEFESIINRLSGIDADDLTLAETQILKIAQKALEELRK